MDYSFRRYLEQCPDGVLATDRQGRIEYANAAYERLTGYAREELVGRTPALLKSGMHEADFYRRLWCALLAGEEFRAVFCNRRKDGRIYYEDKIVRPVEGEFVSFGRDVTARPLAIEKLSYAATHDSLTGLPNRSLFQDRLQQALHHAARREEEITVAIMDIDRFRDTNNRYGHLATAAGPAAARVLQEIVEANGAPVPFDSGKLPVSVSIGACAYPREAASSLELHKLADQRMYEAKRAGGNRCVLG